MDLEVRPLTAPDLDRADRVFRDAFGAFLGTDMYGDSDVLRTRFRAGHTVTLGAFAGDDLIGSTVVTRWGSVAYLGPLSVAPARWAGGVGSTLLDATMEVFRGWGATHQGLFTYAHSPGHHRLYQRFGFWPRFITAIMSRPVHGTETAYGWRLSGFEPAARPALVRVCARVAGAVLEGFEVTGEIAAVLDQGLGDVLLVGEPDAPRGFAVCHTGAGSEAGSGTTFVKVAVVAPGPGAADVFGALLAGGFRTDTPGVTMHRPNEPGYDRDDVYVLDDWR